MLLYLEFGPGSGGVVLWVVFLFLARMAILFSMAEQFVLFYRGRYEKLFCAIILNLGQCLRKKCHLKIFLSLGLVAFLFSGAELLKNIFV